MKIQLYIVLFAAVLLSVGATIMLRDADDVEGASAVEAPEGMVYVDGGSYIPLYAAGREEDESKVEPFFLDAVPVTNADFLKFVEANPKWQRSRVPAVFADDGYLKRWSGDLQFDPELANKPVVGVSWFAAQAYADWVGKRLPTTAEWELAALASETSADASDDPNYKTRIVEWYSRPHKNGLADVGSIYQNYYGAWDLHGLVWEWVDDFNEALVTGDSRDNIDMDLELFCGSGAVNATDVNDYAGFIRFAFRSGLEASYTVGSLGFRLASDAPQSTSDRS